MRSLRHALVVSALLFVLSLAAWTQHEPTPPHHQPQGQQQKTEDGAARRAAEHQSSEQQLAHASEEAADPHAKYKESASVRWLADRLGLGVTTASWLSFVLNFAVVAFLIYLVVKAKVPGLLRDRTSAIRHQMEEARRVSDEANRRLSDIEGRLSRLDSEIAAMHSTAETEAAAEERRIRQATEEDTRKIVAAAEQEIQAAARQVRRELKAYAAELAVGLAEKKLTVDAATDKALVRSFTDDITRNGA